MPGPSARRAPLPDSRDRDPDPGLGGHPAPAGRHALQGADAEPAQVRLSHQPPLRPQRGVSACPEPRVASESGSSTRAPKTPHHCLSLQQHTSFLAFPREKALRGAARAMPKAGGGMSCSWLCALCPNTSSVPCAHTALPTADKEGGCDFVK